MTHVATLICNPGLPALDDGALAAARAALPAAQTPRWLDDGIAADIPFSAGGADGKMLAERVRARLGGKPVDVVVQEAAARRKKLFVADMDSTMIDQECIDELADYAGLKAHVAAITERAMRGEIAFEPALRERVALLKGLPVAVVAETIRNRITLAAGGRTLVATLRANGCYTCLVSGGFTLFTGPIAAAIGFAEHRGNTLVIEDGKFAGRVDEPILGREAKLVTLTELRDKLKLVPEDTMAIGDGANDLDMIAAAGLGIAFNAKPTVRAAADASVSVPHLDAVLYLLGISRSDVETADAAG